MKKVDVYTYCDPLNWAKHSQFQEMKSALHICATSNMKRGIEAKYKSELSNVKTVRDVLTKFKLFNNWYNPEKRMKQYLHFSMIIKQFQFTTTELKDAFIANREEVLNSIRFFVQAGLSPEDLIGKLHSQREHDFRKLWSFYEAHDMTLKMHRKLLKEGKQYSLQFSGEFQLSRESKKIYLHGFYFITPEQQLFFKFLQNNGFELVFFQYYDPRFPNTFDFIRLFIDDEYGWSSDWKIEACKKGRSSIATLFLESYEKKAIGKVEADMEITKYSTFFDFLQDVIIPNYPLENKPKPNEKDLKIFATNATELNELVQMYYPSLDKENRKFLSHPIGRFLLNIHQVLDGNEFVLTSELLIELFSSGWLVDDSTNQVATDYTYDLQQLLPYFTDCRTIEQWLERIQLLALKKEELEKAFPSKSKDRNNRYLRSPFVKLSYFNVELERVAQIKEFIQGIRLVAEDLFGTDIVPTTSMNQHFSRLLKMLEKRKKMDIYTNKLENELLDTLILRLESITDSIEFLFEDIQPALHLYLSGKFDDPEILGAMITDFLEFDGEIFKDQNHPVYFTAVDEKSLPIKEAPLPWPIQQKTFEKLAEQHKPIELLLNRNATVKETSRFLFFIALKFIKPEHLKMSWIVNRMDAEGVNSALYTRQLHMKEKIYSPMQKSKESLQQEITQDVVLTDKEAQAFLNSIDSQGILAEFVQCPKRFYYSYILQEYAVHEEDFMHEFLFSNIYRVAAGSTNRQLTEIVSDLEPYFPQFKRFRMYSIANDSHKYIYNFQASNAKHKLLINHVFPGLKNSVREKLMNSVDVVTIRNRIIEPTQQFEAKKGYHCRFCAHKSYCPDAQFSLDKEEVSSDE